jgi:hypothetical protein
VCQEIGNKRLRKSKRGCGSRTAEENVDKVNIEREVQNGVEERASIC